MKTINIFKSLALLAALVCFAACEQQLGTDGPEAVTPNFPELVENYAVQPGSIQEVVFIPNLDWKITIPSEMRQWFWIQDGTFKVTELTGTASEQPVKVLIGVTETAEFDKNFSCDVTLQMGDSTKVVAKYMLPAKEKTIQVYVAKTLSDSEFELAEDGTSYVYSTDEATKFDLIWSASDADFRLPVKVVSNCEWRIDVPEWAEVNVPETTTGVVELVLMGESIEGASGKIAFCYGESKLVELDVTIPSCGGVEVYSPKFVDGEFEYGDEGDYAWSEAPVNEISLEWLGSDFRVPVNITSKCNWTVEMPEWLSVELPEKTAGNVTLTFLGVSSKYPLNDAFGKVIFKKGDIVIHEVKVNIPGCKDILSYALNMGLTELEYNHLGEFKTSTGYVEGAATGTFTGSKDVRVLAVETTGNKVGVMNPDWFKVEIAAWNTASGAEVLQERTINLSAEANPGDSRSAVLFILPPSTDVEYTKFFNENATVKDAYAQWAIMVSQASEADMEYIQIDESEESEYPCFFENATDEKTAELTALFGETEYVYVLTYDSPYSRDNAYMTMLSEYASYKIFTKDDTITDMSQVEDFWLKFTSGVAESKSGIIDMYVDIELPVKPSIGYVVFYGFKDEVLAIVECVSPYVEEMLQVDVTTIPLVTGVLTESINVTSNVAWTASSNADWCSVSPASGNKNGVITITVTENDTDQDRIAEITVKSENIIRVVTVKQELGDVIEVDVEELSFDCLSASAVVKVTSNVSWNVESSEAWCTVAAKSDEMNSDIVVSVSMNNSTSDREAIVTIKSENKSKTIKVCQKYDDGSVTNGDELVHFVDWNEARAKGAILQRLTSGELFKEYSDGSAPVYHLLYTQVNEPLRIVLPSTVKTHNVNPWVNSTLIKVNGTVYSEYRGPSGRLGEVVLDGNSSVEISMELPDGKNYIRGNINFLPASGDGIDVIIICTLDPNAN